MFRDDVIAHYAGRGYKVHESVQLRGETGRVHPCDIVAEGPLGNLVVTVRDEGGATELASLRAKGKDLSATPVLAVPEASADIRRAAMQMGIAVLQEGDLAPEPTVVATPQAEATLPPWPEPKRPSAPTAETDGLWTTTRGVDAPAEGPAAAAVPQAAGSAGSAAAQAMAHVAPTDSPTAHRAAGGGSTEAMLWPATARARDDAAPQAAARQGAPQGAATSWLDGLTGQAPRADVPLGAQAGSGPTAATARAPLRPLEDVVRLVDQLDVDEADALAADAAGTAAGRMAGSEALPPRPALQSERRLATRQRERPSAQQQRRGTRRPRPARAASRSGITRRHVAQAAVAGVVAGLVMIAAAAFLL